MTNNLPRPIADVDRVRLALSGLIDGVRPDQWTSPTPCEAWDVRNLVDHMVLGTIVFDAILRRTAPPDRSADHLGEDPPGAFRAAAGSFVEALSAPGALTATYPTFLGDQSGESIAGMRITEYLVHGWDLARASGQSPDTLPADLAEASLAAIRPRLDGVDRAEMSFFGAAKDAPAGAPAIDRLAAYLGRNV
ncbi:MAG: TIGR03086 family metal-binding protein [Candidatus Dormibacteria bacterium]